MGIEGNDRADELAKEATDLEPAIEITTLAKLHRQIRERLKTEWISEWANKPISRPITAFLERITRIPNT